jgi:RNA polymerase sigma-54 factor
MALSQGLQQKLLQRLSPQQIQFMKLLQVPTSMLEERIKEELEENPALEQGAGEEEKISDSESSEDGMVDEQQEYGEEEGEEETPDLSDYILEDEDDDSDYKTKEESYVQEEHGNAPVRMETSFHDLLIHQLGLLQLNERDQVIAEQIVGSIDDDGYLRRDNSAIVNDLAFRQNIEAGIEEIELLIQKIQQFDPPGICARNLQECLLNQLLVKQKKKPSTITHAAIAVIEQYFEEFSKKHYEKIQRSLGLTEDQMKKIIQEIIRLNPKPGGAYASTNKAAYYILPDFLVHNLNGRLELTLNSKNAPDLRVSEGYREMLRDYEKGSKKDKRQKEAVLFIKQKIDAARWFIDAIRQRQSTLLQTMNAILEYQHDFFLTGDETKLRPMILKDIAARTGLDISTVSRVANSKFVQTEFGTFRLKYFFSEALATDSGEEVSTREVKKIIQELIAQEDKRNPISDDRLTELLQEKGYQIARRTVAKYRQQLNIPVARLRIEL